jgi:hypothetical protein
MKIIEEKLAIINSHPSRPAASGNESIVIAGEGDEGHGGLEVFNGKHVVCDEMLEVIDLGGHVWARV